MAVNHWVRGSNPRRGVNLKLSNLQKRGWLFFMLLNPWIRNEALCPEKAKKPWNSATFRIKKTPEKGVTPGKGEIGGT